MLEKLKMINDIYDFMALCCSYIFNELECVPYNFGRFNENQYTEVEDAIFSYLDDKVETGRRYAFEQLKNFVEEYSNVGNAIKLDAR